MRKVVTLRQARDEGLSTSAVKHRVARGRWQRIFPSVYATHSGDISWRDRLLAATLARGNGAVASGECALNLWGLSDREPGIITLAEPAATHRRRQLQGVRTRRRRRLTAARRHGIPVTGVAQTVLDAAGEARRNVDDVVALITRAVTDGKVTVADLREELLHHPRHPRRQLLDEVLRAADEGLESVAEVRYVELVEEPHGLPRMERQVVIDADRAKEGGHRRRTDMRDRHRRLRVEIDGELFHRERLLADRVRDRQAVGEGDATLRVGWVEILTAACDVAVDVGVAQVTRGWQGRPHGCSDACPVGRDARFRKTAG